MCTHSVVIGTPNSCLTWGIPSHMIVNPEPHLRPLSIRPPDGSHSSNNARTRSSRGESTNPANLPVHFTPVTGPTDSGVENPPPNPEPRRKKKQRVHVTVSESHTETITAPRITTGDAPPADAPTTDESDSGHRSHASNPRTRPPPMEVVNRAASASERPRPAPSPERPRGEEPARETVTDPAMPPPSTINHELRPWTGAEDHELISYKSDARAGPACKTIGQRLRRAPESCRARWIWLKQTRPDLNSRTEPEAED